MRLDKFLCGAASVTRSEAKKLLAGGFVTVEGNICRAGDMKISEDAAVTLRGAPLRREQYVYLMLNKPKGVVSASRDARDKTVADFAKAEFPRRTLFPAGRLDKDSEGFILLTDDGAFAHDILSPRRHVSKTYLVEVDAPLTEEMQAGFAQGVTLADGQGMLPAQLLPLGPYLAQVVLSQGVYHQIKRMFGVYGAGVVSLKRTAIGGVLLDEGLAPGAYRRLTQKELESLRGK
ncbi:MAG: 16S rRNA pseudouridine(516) synthase [Oscillospiraceae bacterium]|nr:16S rRNA pseudouridine(516) synthase [Oscillospiraceae bacterium]